MLVVEDIKVQLALQVTQAQEEILVTLEDQEIMDIKAKKVTQDRPVTKETLAYLVNQELASQLLDRLVYQD